VRQREEVQEMPRCLILALVICLAFSLSAEVLPHRVGTARQTREMGSVPMQAPDSEAFKEFGFVWSEAGEYRSPKAKGTLSMYRMKDATGALAAWDWLRPADAHRCQLADHCAAWGNTILVNDANYVLEFRGLSPTKADMQSLVSALPDRHPSDLPPVLNFVPLKDLVPNSARYILGLASLGSVAPELVGAKPGFENGAEAHYTAYRVHGGTVKLVLFDYPSPEMARIHTVDFKVVPGTQVKRSGVLVAVILPGATERQGEAVLDQVKYQAKILWNEPPPPNPVPTLYKLLVNIIVVSLILIALALTAGIIYGMMRLYRRRFGTLEEDEAMTTLHLNG
jgi:hypothetical protein